MAGTGKELTVAQEKALSLRDYLGNDSIKQQLAGAMPKWLDVDRMLRVVLTSVLKNPRLLDCTRESILSSIMQCCQLGLEPILGRAHLIPYLVSKNIGGKWQKVYECQFQPGYQGLVDLGRRTGKVQDVYAHVVYSNEIFNIEYGTERKIVHKPHMGEDRGKPIGAYAVWVLEGGFKSFDFMPIFDIYKRRDVSQAYQYAAKQLAKNANDENAKKSPWIAWEEEMIKKTVIKYTAKMAPASIEFMQAIELDTRADLGKSQAGMYLDLEAGIKELDIDSEVEEQKEPPPDTSAFIDLVEAETMEEWAYDPEGKDDLSKCIKLFADSQTPPVTPDDLMGGVKDQESFVIFWNAYQRWLEKWKPKGAEKQEPEKQTPPPPPPETTETEEPAKEQKQEKQPPVNPFDKFAPWKSSKMSKVGLAKFYKQNWESFEDASEESKQGFYEKWMHRFTDENGVTMEPFPVKNYPLRETTVPPEETDGDNRSENLKAIMENEEALYLRACEECGYNSMLVPEILEEQNNLWEMIEELRKEEGKF